MNRLIGYLPDRYIDQKLMANANSESNIVRTREKLNLRSFVVGRNKLNDVSALGIVDLSNDLKIGRGKITFEDQSADEF